MCLWDECEDECTSGGQENACGPCMEDRCSEPLEACNSGDPEYEHHNGGRFWSCLDIRTCVSDCVEQREIDDDCVFQCYWLGSADARVDYMTFLFAPIDDICGDSCEEIDDSCLRCLGWMAEDLNISGCYREVSR